MWIPEKWLSSVKEHKLQVHKGVKYKCDKCAYQAMSTDINFLFSRELNIAVTYVNTSVQNKKVLGYINLLFINIDMAM